MFHPPRSQRARHLLSAFLVVSLSPLTAFGGCLSYQISEPITSAAFIGDFAELVADRYVAGFEVNRVRLLGIDSMVDLSAQFFGTTPPTINQSANHTHVYSVPIPASFYPVLQTGAIGYDLLFTDTSDGIFAMDFVGLRITTPTRTIDAFLDPNDGYGKGIADDAMLPETVLNYLPPDPALSGFDEPVSSVALYCEVPEPGTFWLIALGGMFLALARFRGKLRKAPYVILLALLCALPGYSKKVYCISADPDLLHPFDLAPFLANAEGWVRQTKLATDEIVIGGSFENCFQHFQTGQPAELEIIMRTAARPGGGTVWVWNGLQYEGVGPEADQLHIPSSWIYKPSEIFVQFTAYRSQFGLPDFVCFSLIGQMREQGITGHCRGYDGLTPAFGVLLKTNPISNNLAIEASRYLMDPSRIGWMKAFPVNRGFTPNQITQAQALLNAHFGQVLPGGVVVGTPITIQSLQYVRADHSIPPNVTCDGLPVPVPQFVPQWPCSAFDLYQGNVVFLLLGQGTSETVRPTALRLTGPMPNRLAVGSGGIVTAVVSAAGGVVAPQDVRFYVAAGGARLTSPGVSADGRSVIIRTDAQNAARATFTTSAAGTILIQARVVGTQLAGYVMIVAY